MKKSFRKLTPPQFRLFSFGKFLKETPEVAEDLIDGIFAGEGNALDHGQYRAGKFWWIALKILALCMGAPLLGRFQVQKRARVLYFGEEDSAARVKERLLGLCNGMGITPSDLDDWLFISARQGLSFDKDDHKVWIRKQMGLVQPDVIVIDPLRGVTHTGDGGASEIHDFFRFIRELQNTSIQQFKRSLVVQFVHHDRKNDTIVDSRAASGVIADKCEVIHQVSKIHSEKSVDQQTKRQVLEFTFGITLQDYKFDIPNALPVDMIYHFGIQIRTEKQFVFNRKSKRFRWKTLTSTATFVSADQLFSRNGNKDLSDAVLAACAEEWRTVTEILPLVVLPKKVASKKRFRELVRRELFRLKVQGRVECNGKKKKFEQFRVAVIGAAADVDAGDSDRRLAVVES